MEQQRGVRHGWFGENFMSTTTQLERELETFRLETVCVKCQRACNTGTARTVQS